MKKYLFVTLVTVISFAILSSLATFFAIPSNANVSEASYASLSTLVDNKQVPDKILFTGKMKKTTMDHFYHYLVSASRSIEEHDRITIPTNHMNTLREYLKNHEPVGGLPSVGLSFTGVSIWEYKDLTIFVSDDNSVSFYLGEISFDLQNNLHLDEDSILDFSHCEFVDGWLLEPSFTLSYWNLGKKVASYHLPELEINEFMVWNGRAVILTSNQIITASQENYQTFDIEETIFRTLLPIMVLYSM